MTRILSILTVLIVMPVYAGIAGQADKVEREEIGKLISCTNFRRSNNDEIKAAT